MEDQTKSALAEWYRYLGYGYYSIVSRHGKCEAVKNGNTFMKN